LLTTEPMKSAGASRELAHGTFVHLIADLPHNSQQVLLLHWHL
jgi:hypothetical protein